jgi:two-component system chemotaxis response regulator CheY
MARIMIVDDSLVARRMLRKMLTEGGHEVVCEAADGAAAIDLYRVHRPDLVTMDINMPKLNGLLASEHIHAEFPAALIVMVTSLSAADDVRHALRAGAVSYLLKPFTQEKVVEVIGKALLTH